MSETAFNLAAAQERVRRGREIVAQQEQRDAIRKGCGVYFESGDKLLVTFRASQDLFEDHLAYLTRVARPVAAQADSGRVLVAVSV